MLLEHKIHSSRLQSEVSILAQNKNKAEVDVEDIVNEISEFQEGVRTLEFELLELSKIETEATGVLDENARWQLREQKRRLDTEFSSMTTKIADRKERLEAMEHTLRVIDRHKQDKEEAIRDLEKKLVVLLEDQQAQLDQIKIKQDSRTQVLVDVASGEVSAGTLFARSGETGGGNGGQSGGVTQKQRAEANALMETSESLMKFGFASMSMTYFTSMNMVKSMRKLGVHQTLLDGAADTSQAQPGAAGSAPGAYTPELAAGQLPGQQAMRASGWSVHHVGGWLDSLMLHQYKEAFFDAAVDGAFLYELSDEVKNTKQGLHSQ